MSIVTLEFDNNLKKSEIVMPIISASMQEGGENYSGHNLTDKAQTKVFGIQVPLIMINSTIIDFDSIKYFSLKSNGRLPELIMSVEDKFELINNIDKPAQDNEVRIQIIPRFDNAYKKIDLTFFITDIYVDGKNIRMTCMYKLPALLSSQFKSFGKIDTYTLFKNIACETNLGFAANIANLNDDRYIYCDNKSLFDIMDSEIEYSNATEHIIDWWIDFWDNINLVDIQERYNSVDMIEDMQIWIAGQVNEVNADTEVKPQKVDAVINNLAALNASELFVKSYVSNLTPGSQIIMGTDKIYGIYEDKNKEHIDFFIQDGDIKKDIFVKYAYEGETYGDYNYILAKCIRSGFMQKINSETINVTLQSPLLGLMRGHKVNFIRYVNDDIIENKLNSLEKSGVIDRDVESNISLSNYEVLDVNGGGQFRIDKTVSGQYLIYGVNIIYTNNAWEYVLTLVKPALSKTNILKNNQ